MSAPSILPPAGEIRALAEALTDLPDAPEPVRRVVGAELLYALGLAVRPQHTPVVPVDLGRAA